jgi:SAM-dependent methyltransferase
MTMTIDVPLPPAAAFESVLEELQDALARGGYSSEFGPNGWVVQNGEEIGKVTAWEPGLRLAFDWRPAPWKTDERSTVELRFAPTGEGSRISFNVIGWGGLFAEESGDLTSWFASGVLAPLVRSISPQGLGDWLTDRSVRRPTGPKARENYGNPIYHWPNFLLILDRIGLTPEDRLLEVGCGGGAFMRRALESGCRATAIDHSPEMVRLTAAQNEAAVASGVLDVRTAEADHLPVSDSSFTCAVMTGVIGFLPDPLAALAEMRRALRSGGRIAIFGSTSKLKGTPAAPEPFASRIRFFEKPEFDRLGREAGFVDVRVEEPDLEQYARVAKVPEEAMPLFRGNSGALLLMGRKP